MQSGVVKVCPFFLLNWNLSYISISSSDTLASMIGISYQGGIGERCDVGECDNVGDKRGGSGGGCGGGNRDGSCDIDTEDSGILEVCTFFLLCENLSQIYTQ